MDVGPIRGSRPTERRGAPSQPAEPQPAQQEPRPAPARPASPRQQHTPEPSRLKKLILPVVVLVIIALVAVGGWFAYSRMNTGAPAIDTGKYQAVFFTNGQVYFGKLESLSGSYFRLTDVYYLQNQQQQASTDKNNPQQSSNAQNNVQLIKLGDEIHGPEDVMVISRDQVLFYENLKPDGKVAQSIDKYKNSK